jgi:hypothetical protein
MTEDQTMTQPAYHYLAPEYRDQLRRERLEAMARQSGRGAQVVSSPATKCEYCFARLRPDQDRFCSTACQDAHWRLMPVW